MSNLQNQDADRKEYLTTNEVANLILRTAGSVRRLVAEGKIPYRKPNGRFMFPLDEIKQWIEGAPAKTINEIGYQS